MSIFTAPGGCSGTFTEVDCNDDTGGFNQRAGISRILDSGTPYYIAIWTGTLPDLEDTNSNYAVELLVTRPVVPPAASQRRYPGIRASVPASKTR